MLHVLLESSAPRPRVLGEGALFSVVTHGAVIALALFSGPPPRSIAEDEGARETVKYLVPLDRINEPRPQQESVAWMDPGALSGNFGLEDRPVEADAPVTAQVKGKGEDEGEPETSTLPQRLALYDSVATELDVDSAATRVAESAAPVYPPSLLERRIEGVVYVRYVVDTTGLADTASFQVMSTTHPAFAEAVRSALPNMRFTPAVMGSKRVRQLVEQPFAFRIQQSASRDTMPQ